MNILEVPFGTVKTLWKGVKIVQDFVCRTVDYLIDHVEKDVGVFEDPDEQMVSDNVFGGARKLSKWSVLYPGFPTLPAALLYGWATSAQAVPLPF